MWSRCFLKSSLTQVLRSRRASISRAFWNTQDHHDEKRFSPFSPRLGKRENQQEEEDNDVVAVKQTQPLLNTIDMNFLKAFYTVLANSLDSDSNDVIYQDDKYICVTQQIIEDITRQVNEMFYNNANRRNVFQGDHKYFLHPYENALIFRARTG
ncbi:unnamed protein product [Didymodactylos carnosus]|uniref:Uncharacterized protein n=2 Tax=Didymodactylos carnosus TaxID=1234261 RepID=A0A813PYS6_9BILA|nr:unnamed protein product [Didymodactylos carnosus]CAF3538504.1 unnamed protein product [Didymodactylos carnosus]